MSTLAGLMATRGLLQGMLVDVVPFELSTAIAAALAPPAPGGSPGAIHTQAQAYAKTAAQCQAVAADIQRVAVSALPDAWRGQVADTAAQAFAALATEIGTIEAVLGEAANALSAWAEVLEWAQAKDAEGRAQLKNAQQLASGFNPFSKETAQARNLALTGVDARISAAQTLADDGPRTASLLNQYTSQARAHDVTTVDIDPLSAVVLATVANPGGGVDGADILTPTALTRASQRLDAMSAADQAAFQRLLSGAKSPQEAAFLDKALAAGYSLQQVETFDAAIHAHGDDATWLAEHLTPDLSNQDPPSGGTNWVGVQYIGANPYSQGTVDDCVAASTVIAQASLDPILMLSLTTGYGQPKGSTPAPGDDSAAALQQRLQQIYLQEYAFGRGKDGGDNGKPGIGSNGENALANTLLPASTGTTYQHQDLSSTGDRQAAVVKIEAAVDSGKPVIFDVTNGPEGHQMLIIGRNGDELEVYNPWGFTTWISESQFVNGELGSLTSKYTNPSKGLPTATGVELPQ